MARGIELIRSDVDPVARVRDSYSTVRNIQRDRAEDAAASALVMNQPEATDPTARARQSAIQDIASRPGGGVAALKAQQTDEASRQKASDAIYAGIKEGSPESLFRAKQLAQQHNINIPEEIWTDARSRGFFVGFVDQARKLGITTPEQWKQHSDRILKAQGNPQQVATEVAATAPEQRKPYTTYTTDQGELGVITTGPSGTRAEPLHIKGRAGRGGGAGGAGGRGFEFQAKIKALVAQGVPEDIATRAVVLKQNVTPQDRLRMANNLMKATDHLGRPKYQNIAEAQAAADRLIQEIMIASQAARPPATPSSAVTAPTSRGNIRVGGVSIEPIVSGQQPHNMAGGTEAYQVENDDDYDALPSGAMFVGPDGVTRRKP